MFPRVWVGFAKWAHVGGGFLLLVLSLSCIAIVLLFIGRFGLCFQTPSQINAMHVLFAS